MRRIPKFPQKKSRLGDDDDAESLFIVCLKVLITSVNRYELLSYIHHTIHTYAIHVYLIYFINLNFLTSWPKIGTKLNRSVVTASNAVAYAARITIGETNEDTVLQQR